MKRSRSAFTLIELLMVVVVIGILAGMVIAVLKPGYFYGKGRDARRRSDLYTIKAALELYRLDQANRQFPGDISDATLQGYIQGGSVPRDPQSDAAYGYTVYSPESSDPNYRKCFKIAATLEEKDDAGGSKTCTVCGGTLSCLQAAGWSGSCSCD